MPSVLRQESVTITVILGSVMIGGTRLGGRTRMFRENCFIEETGQPEESVTASYLLKMLKRLQTILAVMNGPAKRGAEKRLKLCVGGLTVGAWHPFK